MAIVHVTRELPGDALQRIPDAGHQLVVRREQMPPSPAELRRIAADADALITTLADRVNAELLDAAPRLKVVANYAVGADNIDVQAALRRDIAVGVTPDVLTDATADMTLALLLSVARHIPVAARTVTDGAWKTWEPAGHLGLELRGARLLVVGPGRIGRAVGERAAAFGMDVTYAGRDADLLAVLPDADVVTLHVPLSLDTRKLIGEAELAAMKPGALLINTARGGLVDQDALVDALERGHLGGAGLDVTTPEPLPPHDPLLELPNVLVLPHIGSATVTARHRMTELAVGNVLAALDGDPLPNPAKA
ncbi:D-glycerate dehydrogenase [Svornostia abyssi]|uniref:D-glycerate dehydrogenase n=1 Tax=Svornostia abyssi TaxID=2898438 RepID=A0ABY5PMG1_9ACTN|nr:D-glycerate dehydrogenase [Parviterribacteraceae bacterium J379]